MSLWSYITGTTPQDEQQAGLDLEKQRYDAALARREAAGTISEEAADKGRAYENGVVLEDTDAGALQGFKEGAKEGLDNVLNFPGEVVGAAGKGAGQVLANILKNIPWWVYLGAIGALFFYFAPILMPILRAVLRRVVRR